MMQYQWGIFQANLNPSKGSEQAGIRPVLVVSSEGINQVLPIVTILSVTSLKPGRKVYPTEVLLDSESSGLKKDSLAMAHQIRAISKERIGERIGGIGSDEQKDKIRAAMKVYLDLF